VNHVIPRPAAQSNAPNTSQNYRKIFRSSPEFANHSKSRFVNWSEFDIPTLMDVFIAQIEGVETS
jgi:predicted alpha/beta hydrolase